MKKQKSSTIVLSEFSSSDDESEKATTKIDKEELKKYLKDSDEESSQDQISPNTTPKRPKNVERLKTLPIEDSPITKPKKVISKEPPQSYIVQGDDFKKLQKKAKKLKAKSLDYSKRKNYKYMVEYKDKKIHFGSAKTEDYLTHHDPVRRDKYLSKAKKISNKDGQLTYQIPSYPNYWSVKLFNLKK